MEWIQVRHTRLAEELNNNLRKAGKLFSRAGFAKKKAYDEETMKTCAWVEYDAAELSRSEILTLIKPPKPEENKTEAVVRAEMNIPSYNDMVKILEDLTALTELQREKITELEDEVRQLRQLTNPTNGMRERAKKALVHAERSLKLYD